MSGHKRSPTGFQVPSGSCRLGASSLWPEQVCRGNVGASGRLTASKERSGGQTYETYKFFPINGRNKPITDHVDTVTFTLLHLSIGLDQLSVCVMSNDNGQPLCGVSPLANGPLAMINGQIQCTFAFQLLFACSIISGISEHLTEPS